MFFTNEYFNIVLWFTYIISVIIGAEVFAYLWHRYGAHDNYIPGIKNTHDIHHIMDHTHEANEDFIWILLLMILFELGLGIGVMIGIVNGVLAIITIVIASIVFWWNWWIHRAYHQSDHWLNMYDWFKNEKNRHYIHHSQPNKNYGIASHFTDRVMGTWTEPTSILND
jgi:sterol desaturase/sphingolipid hydroxylase (fatty acid hydroxylase superfamily)